nr:MAG TPA: hypothetical protein [Caudoviricetes sp.]
MGWAVFAGGLANTARADLHSRLRHVYYFLVAQKGGRTK